MTGGCFRDYSDREDAVLAEYAAGHRIGDIAKKYGTSAEYVSRLASRNGLSRFARPRRYKIVPDWVPDDLVSDYQDTVSELGQSYALAHVRQLMRDTGERG